MSDPDLLAEVDQLFFGEHARYKTGGIVSYVFTVGPSATNGTDRQYLGIRRRDKSERHAVLLAPDENGLVRRTHEVNATSCGRICKV